MRRGTRHPVRQPTARWLLLPRARYLASFLCLSVTVADPNDGPRAWTNWHVGRAYAPQSSSGPVVPEGPVGDGEIAVCVIRHGSGSQDFAFRL